MDGREGRRMRRADRKALSPFCLQQEDWMGNVAEKRMLLTINKQGEDMRGHTHGQQAKGGRNGLHGSRTWGARAVPAGRGVPTT